MLRSLQLFFGLLAKSRISLLGAAIVTTGFLLDLVLLGFGEHFLPPNPYIGIFTLQVVPGGIAFGLALIPAGLLLAARRIGSGKIDLDSLQHLAAQTNWALVRRVGAVVGFLTMINLSFFAVVSYEGLHYVDSVEFCGQVCHHVMGPEYTVYQLSPHAGVACVECHIGPGPEYFVKAKVNGARQVVQVATNTYHRPIGVPVHALRPAHEICGHCHHEQQYRGDRMKVLQQRDEDRDNTPRHTVVNLRLGGEGGHGWEPQGIHWHASRDVKLTFRTTDHQRQDVVSIRVEQDGEVRTWSRRGRDEHGREIGEGGGGTEASVDAHEAEDEHGGLTERVMDCTDCHNRTGHHYLGPEEALDERFATGELDETVPWLKKEALALLAADHASDEEAETAIGSLPERYRAAHPEDWERHGARVEAAVDVVFDTWATHVHPEMNIAWGTYRSEVAHGSEESELIGCYRCHNDELVADKGGDPVTNDCELCHYVLAVDEPDPEVFRCLTVVRSVSLFGGGEDP